ncbi:MAG: hypothetical protein HY913_04555 [Desulfomonile tiedjei]|nr:hypothetical protein [Desulfomonile tiedjei]
MNKQARVNAALEVFRGELEDLIVQNPHLDMPFFAGEISMDGMADVNWHLIHLLVQDLIDKGQLPTAPEGFEEGPSGVGGTPLNAGEERRIKEAIEYLETETPLTQFVLDGAFTMKEIVGMVALSSSIVVADHCTHILVKRMYDQGKIKEYPEGYQRGY